MVPASDRAASTFKNDTSTPLSLSPGDFNNDGVPDLVCGFAAGETGFLTLHPGNPEAHLLPAGKRLSRGRWNDPEPFHSKSSVFSIPVKPDFLFSGDFDNDGNQDILSVKKGGSSIHVIPGNGDGSFSEICEIDVPGSITSAVVGDINRRDGLLDILVAVTGKNGPELLVFESPSGALDSIPERIPLPDAASSLSVANDGHDGFYDCIACCGKELAIVHGRDRRLSLGETAGAWTTPVKVTQTMFSSRVLGSAAGDFLGGLPRELAVLTGDGTIHFLKNDRGKKESSLKCIARYKTTVFLPEEESSFDEARFMGLRISSSPKDDLLVLNGTTRIAELIVNTPFDGESERKSRVITTDDPVPNTGEKWDDPRFHSLDIQKIPLLTSGKPVALLPMRLNMDSLDDLVVLQKGTTNPAGVLLTASAAVFTVTDPGDEPDSDPSDDIFSPKTFRSAIENANKTMAQDTIMFSLPQGTMLAPKSPYPTLTYPILIDGSLGTGGGGETLRVEINGSSLDDDIGLAVRNDSTILRMRVKQFKNIGIALAVANGNNTVQGNEVLFNEGPGININSDGNTIGGATDRPGDNAGNWAAGNFGTSGQGIAIVGGDNNKVMGNLSGTNRAGDAPSSNVVGILVRGVGNQIGGVNTGEANVVSGNDRRGIELIATFPEQTDATLVQGNYVGTDISGTKVVPGQKWGGVSMDGGKNTTVGGTADLAWNVIGGNTGSGISMANTNSMNPITGTLIQGNYIGIDEFEGIALPNLAGITIGERDNVVGGTSPEAMNIVVHNRGTGIRISGEGGGPPNLVIGNRIGTDSGGVNNCGNGGSGVLLWDTNTNVGGDGDQEKNVICWNGRNGVTLDYSSTTGNIVKGNNIGTDPSGTSGQPNAENGIEFLRGAHHNTIEKNLISGNGENGVRIYMDPGDAKKRNSHDNQLIGNLIGVNAAGKAALPNLQNGILIDGCTSTTVSSTVDSKCVISGNGKNGVEIRGGEAQLNLVEKSIIGLDIDESAVLPNGENGVLFTVNAHHNLIGGGGREYGNVISGNTGNGVKMVNAVELLTYSNRVQGNLIGTDGTGKKALGNGGNGVLIENGRENMIGGIREKYRNVISGNGIDGVALEGLDARENLVAANYIGTDIEGKTAIPNQRHGVFIHQGKLNDIGFSGAWMSKARNIIAGNKSRGVFILGDKGNPITKGENFIIENLIGLNIEIDPLGNKGSGVYIENASDNKIEDNDIAHNIGYGVAIVAVDEAEGNLISTNYIYKNSGLGIDLGADNVTPNDANDADGGANRLQNFPRLSAFTSGTMTLVVSGVFQGRPRANLRIEFFFNEVCDPSGFGEGEDYLGRLKIVTDDDGYASFRKTFPGYGIQDAGVTATATDSLNNTSEFSRCARILGPLTGKGFILYGVKEIP